MMNRKRKIEDWKPPKNPVLMQEACLALLAKRKRTLKELRSGAKNAKNHGNRRSSHDRKSSTSKHRGKSTSSKSHHQTVVKREPMSPPHSHGRYGGFGMISTLQQRKSSLSSLFSIKKEPVRFSTFDNVTASTSIGQQGRAIKQEICRCKNGLEATFPKASTSKLKRSSPSTNTQNPKNTQAIRPGSSKTIKSERTIRCFDFLGRDSGLKRSHSPPSTSNLASPAKIPSQRRSTVSGTIANSQDIKRRPSSRKRAHSESSMTPRRTKYAPAEPLPRRIISLIARRSSENYTKEEIKRRQEQKRKWQERVGYEPRKRRHRHPHQARRAEEYQCYVEGRKYEDKDTMEYYYNNLTSGK